VLLEKAEALDGEIEVEVFTGPETATGVRGQRVGEGVAGLVGWRQVDGLAIGAEEGQFAMIGSEPADVATFMDSAVMLGAEEDHGADPSLAASGPVSDVVSMQVSA
jgi:hypothetical protein